MPTRIVDESSGPSRTQPRRRVETIRAARRRSQRAARTQQRQHARTRARILTAAHRLYAVAGYTSVSMRELAKRLRFTAQAIYHYFPSKEAMFAALADEGLRLLEAQHPSEELTDTIDNLRLPYLRYYEFSKAHPEYFTLLWMDPAAAVSQGAPQIAQITRMAEDTRRRIERCMREGLFPPDLDTEQAATLLLGAVHGPAVMGLTGRPPAQGLDRTAHDLLDAAIASLSSGRIRRAVDEASVPAEVT